jgi:hypothetical protein
MHHCELLKLYTNTQLCLYSIMAKKSFPSMSSTQCRGGTGVAKGLRDKTFLRGLNIFKSGKNTYRVS